MKITLQDDLISECCPYLKRNCMKLQPLNFSLQVKHSDILHLFENKTELRTPSAIRLPLPCTIGQKNFIYMQKDFLSVCTNPC